MSFQISLLNNNLPKCQLGEATNSKNHTLKLTMLMASIVTPSVTDTKEMESSVQFIFGDNDTLNANVFLPKRKSHLRTLYDTGCRWIQNKALSFFGRAFWTKTFHDPTLNEAYRMMMQGHLSNKEWPILMDRGCSLRNCYWNPMLEIPASRPPPSLEDATEFCKDVLINCDPTTFYEFFRRCPNLLVETDFPTYCLNLMENPPKETKTMVYKNIESVFKVLTESYYRQDQDEYQKCQEYAAKANVLKEASESEDYLHVSKDDLRDFGSDSSGDDFVQMSMNDVPDHKEVIAMGLVNGSPKKKRKPSGGY